VAGDASAQPSDPSTQRHARGPLRPSQLRSVRVRQARRFASFAFRAIDALWVAALCVTMLLWAATVPLPDIPVVQFVPFAGAVPVLVHVLRASGAYRFDRTRRWTRQVAEVALLTLMVGLGSMGTALLLGAPAPSVRYLWWWALCAAAGLAALHTCWWTLVGRWRRQQWLTPNVVLVGATAGAGNLIGDAIARRDLNVLGIFDDRLARSPPALLGVPVLGDTEALLTHRILPYVDLIVVTIDPRATVRVREIMNRLSTLPNAITMLIDQEEQTARVAAVAHLTDAPLVQLGRTIDPDRKAIGKRMQDLLLGIPMLLLALPVLGIAALAVSLDSPGPVFFRQRRHGFNNEEIMVRKFRTMRHDSADSGADSGADARAERQVTANDDRITRVGRLLRRTSIDELPQLTNVIRGEMSLVGPRPHAIGMKTDERESAQLVAEYAHRHRIKPGLTGWAAINGSRGPLHTQADLKRRVALDVEYIERQTLLLDLKVIALTVPRLFGDSSTIR
jgi:exopolysaccharide biosynthesis polyprenyl glycosylphosphotransferase